MKWKKGSLFEACERGATAGHNACLVELYPDSAISCRIAFEGGILNPYPKWRIFRRRAWQASFDLVRREHDEKKRWLEENPSSPEPDPAEG